MCGIVGIIEKSERQVDIEILKRFNDSLSHRGPDNSSIFINKKKNIGFGHRRLSIIDLRNLGHQPMSIDDRYTIVFNGEIYNFQNIKNELIELGYKFKSNSDTEVLIKAFIEWGAKCQFKFNGMWAFVILDELKKKIFISRDRFGVKPIYYLNTKNSFLFSSELKAFMKLNKSEIPEFDNQTFINQSQNFSNSSYYVGEDTFLKNVKELMPGHQLHMDSNYKIVINKWWKTIDNLTQINGSDDEIKDQFKDLFLDACNLRMISDVKVATSLSGGMDSSSIVSGICQIKNEKKIYQNATFPHDAYILDYVGEKNSETQFAIEASNFSKISTKIVSVKKENFSENEIKKIIFHQEEVTGDDGLGPWEIYKKMNKDGVKVSIDGHGGDELLGGYSGYPRIAMRDTNPLTNILYWFDLLKIHLVMNDKNNDEKKIFKIFADKFKNIILRKLTSKKSQNYENFFYKNSNDRKIIEFDKIDNLSNLNKHLYIDYHYKAMSLNLKKYDKFSMAHSIETRFPFLDYKLACFCFSLSNKFKIKNGFTKKILRDIMKNNLPKSILSRVKKKGFNPENNYFNKSYKDFVFDTIRSQDFQESDIWNGKKILEYVETNKNANLKKIFKFIQIYYLKNSFKDFSQTN